MNKAKTVTVTIGGIEYPLIFTAGAARELAAYIGGLNRLCDTLTSLQTNTDFDTLTYCVTVLANQGILIFNEHNKGAQKQLLTVESVRECASLNELISYIPAVADAVIEGSKRIIESGDSEKKSSRRITDDEFFIRLLYNGTVHLNRAETEIWLLPLGCLMDLIELHRQYLGVSKPAEEEGLMSQVMPPGL